MYTGFSTVEAQQQAYKNASNLKNVTTNGLSSQEIMCNNIY
jgi:hypothetical protein